MQCPKCGGEAYLVDEDLVQVLENVEPPKIIAKAIYQCRSCGEKFTRLISEDLSAKKKQAEPSQPAQKAQGYPGEGIAGVSQETKDKIDNLRFF